MKGKSLEAKRVRSAWWFLSPMLIVLFAVAGWPLLRTIWFGFTNATLDDMWGADFVGFLNFFENYEGDYYGLFFDTEWWYSVYNTFRFSFISVTIETILGLLIALVLHQSFKGRGLFRAAILIPWAIPTIVSAKMWAWMLNDQFGIINDLLVRLHLIAEPIAWVAQPDTAMIAVIFVDVWKTTPFMALLILAGMQMLPLEVYEAAKIDGVHPVKVFFKVTLPLIYPTIMVAMIFRILDALRVFDLIYVLTPGDISTISMSVFARQELVDNSKVGYGSAASTLLFLTIAFVIIIYIRVGRVKLDEK